MKIAGLVKSTLIDYPGKVAAIVFTQGCNFRCGFCHNPELIEVNATSSSGLISDEEVLNFLMTRKGKLDGVVITGGEPLIQPDIVEFIGKVRELGFLVKLDTNGSNPILLESILEQNLVNYIAMDVKTTLGKYKEICMFENKESILKSINIIMKAGVDYEFRTTVLPHYHNRETFLELADLIGGAQKFTIQGFRSQIVYDKKLLNAKSFSSKELREIASIFKNKVSEVVIHDNLA